MYEDDLELRFLQDFNTLTMLARRRGFTVKDVPRDGNCPFSAVEIYHDYRALRQDLCKLYTPDGTCHLRNFVSAPVVNADTKHPTDEDAFIESVQDLDTRADLHWQRYLTRLQQTAWGDHIGAGKHATR